MLSHIKTPEILNQCYSLSNALRSIFLFIYIFQKRKWQETNKVTQLTTKYWHTTNCLDNLIHENPSII